MGKGEKQQMFSFFVQKILDSASILWYNRRGFAAATQFVGPLRGRHHFFTSFSHFGAGDLHQFFVTFALWRGALKKYISFALWRAVARCVGVLVWWSGGVAVW